MINDLVKAAGFGIVLASASLLSAAHAEQTEEAEVVVPPQPKYPRLALWFGWEGYCEVEFAIDEGGYAFSVHPMCTRQNFCFQAKRSIVDAKFKPKMSDGVPVVRTNVTYPLEFVMAGSDYDRELDQRPLKSCEKLAVS